jgi:hypothetical protein
LISFDIGHLNHYCFSALQLAARRAVAIRQEQLDCADLSIDIDLGVFTFSRADSAELLD